MHLSLEQVPQWALSPCLALIAHVSDFVDILGDITQYVFVTLLTFMTEEGNPGRFSGRGAHLRPQFGYLQTPICARRLPRFGLTAQMMLNGCLNGGW